MAKPISPLAITVEFPALKLGPLCCSAGRPFDVNLPKPDTTTTITIEQGGDRAHERADQLRSFPGELHGGTHYGCSCFRGGAAQGGQIGAASLRFRAARCRRAQRHLREER